MIIQNAVIIVDDWPETKYLVSSHVHDFQTYTFRDGTSVSVDGGHDYRKRCFDSKRNYGTRWMEYSLDDQEPFYVIKQKLLWGTRGIDGKQPLKWVRLMDCDADHLQSILDTQQLSPLYSEVIRDILTNHKHVVVKPPKRYIHKSKRPKYCYINPTVCDAKLDDTTAHKLSRIRWRNVTCPICLRQRPHNNF